jgi:radical SAM protein with 4Fe4S-binding SPASM domain
MDSATNFIEEQIGRRIATERIDLAPPLPKKISIEINNSCNHKCFFCPNPTMERSRQVMDTELLDRILRDARRSGIEQVSFYSTGEPFLHRNLANYVRRAKDLGFTYVYLSTNGGRVVSAKIRPALEAGLDSLKFSINAGDRASYALVHGLDEFDDVVANVEAVDAWRRANNPKLRLFVSSVETEISKLTMPALRARLQDIVDEIVSYPFIVIGTPLKRRVEADGTERPYVDYEHVDRSIQLNADRLTLPCFQLWSYLNVTVEGYLSACCSDFNNDLIVGNLRERSLIDAWHSPEFRELRQQHIERRVKNTLCQSCIAQRNLPYAALNPHLKNEPAKRISR